MALLVLGPAGTATWVLLLDSQSTPEKIVQKSSWSHEAEHDRFEQTITGITTEKDKLGPVVTHTPETVRAFIRR
ncbi:hypothetical protein [Pseudomonas sp.]|uniref:hypothetical protein n=1 Tax=Pseudomonas sp. TaxID=306 RepID=UPI0028B03E0F|nr:hypothetical protein [Pseudomonas sp.]